MERRPDPKHLFDRDPLLIPQLFVEVRPPWYKRARWWVAVVPSLGAVTTMGVLVARFGPRGAMERVGDFSVGILHFYTQFFVGRP